MNASTSQILYLINERVNGHKARRNRKILYLRFIDGLTFAEIAEAVDMSEIQVSRIVHKYGDPILMALANDR